MYSKPYIVLGEACESDSEEEIDSSVVCHYQNEDFKGKIVFGEAPESDDEKCTNHRRLNDEINMISTLNVTSSNKDSIKYESVLQKKLCERNISLGKNIHSFVTQTAKYAGNELNATNQQLLKCQIQMQEGAECLKMLNANLGFISLNLNSLVKYHYLPEIRISKDDVEII